MASCAHDQHYQQSDSATLPALPPPCHATTHIHPGTGNKDKDIAEILLEAAGMSKTEEVVDELGDIIFETIEPSVTTRRVKHLPANKQYRIVDGHRVVTGSEYQEEVNRKSSD
jgi:hypothetical protein